MKKLVGDVQKITQCMALGQYGDAQNLLHTYKSDLEKYFSHDHPAYISYENNQGVLWRLNGHFEDAYDLLASVYNKYVKLLGKRHPSTISACVNLATVLRDLKDFDESIKFYEDAREIRLEVLGDNHPDYAMVLGMSAGAYRMNGDTATAYRYLKEAYVIMANNFNGEEWVPCAIILNSMGLLYKQQHKYERALDAYESCLKTREKVQGPSHPDSIATRHNIAELYNVWGKPEEAKTILEENIKYMDQLRKRQEKSQKEHYHGEECNDPTHNH